MKLIYKVLSIIFACAAMTACGNHDDGDLGHHHHDHGSAHAHGDDEEHEAGEIVLEPEMAEMFGLKVEKITPQPFNQVLAVAGQIVDSPNSAAIVAAPASGIVKFAAGMASGKSVAIGSVVATISASAMQGGNVNQVAKAALETTKAEFDRISNLYEHKLVTASDYQNAKLAYEQARAQYSEYAASGRAVAPIAGVVTQLLAKEGEYVEAGTPIASVSSTKRLTLRADVPEKYYSHLPSFTSANIILPYSGAVIDLASHGGKRESSGTAASATRGYAPLYFTFDNDGSVLPGSYVDVNLIGAARGNVLAVPVEALSEQQGAYFVYEQLDEECYKKIPVQIGTSDGKMVEITSGLNGDENIVVAGMIGVRLAESSNVAPEGHSHNH